MKKNIKRPIAMILILPVLVLWGISEKVGATTDNAIEYSDVSKTSDVQEISNDENFEGNNEASLDTDQDTSQPTQLNPETTTDVAPFSDSVRKVSDTAQKKVETQAMYRLYNPNNKEHFYTSSFNEAKVLLERGWGTYEGIGWNSPKSGIPVYRLYNPILKDHHYTMDSNERDTLVRFHGWKYENISFYSDKMMKIPVYRAFKNDLISGSHNYTRDKNEQTILTKQRGWKDEGIAWYGSNITPLDNKDSILQELSDGTVGLNKVHFDKIGSEKRRNWLYQTIKWSIPLAAEGRVYPSVMTAQAILESGWGESGLSVKANNLFGIKKGNWSGEVYQAVTAESAHKDGKYTGYKTQAEANAGGKAQVLNLKKGQYYWIITPFRKYSSQQGSLANYVSVLSQSGYADVRRTQSKDYKASAKALVDEVGWKYATDPKYAQSIINVIETYNLQALD